MTTSKQYKKIKENLDKYNNEKIRINTYLKNKYKENPEFRLIISQKNKEAYQRRKGLT
jgi:hypothetical protein